MKTNMQMVQYFPRKYWIDKIESAWKLRSIVWVSGVRRVGKTILCKSLQDIEYFDCELPATRRILEDPESFLKSFKKNSRIIIDEIHRHKNPSELLKIAADYFPDLKIIATGSSTLGASSKFTDTLTGRKREIWLTPMINEEHTAFGNSDINHRFIYGGLPPFFLSESFPEYEFQEWMDALWAKDIQELFRLERKFSFQRFIELLLTQSGGIFEASRFSHECEVSRITISNYLKILEATFVVSILKPFGSNPQTEIIRAPKVYGFDTGFVSYFKGWTSLRDQDLGHLWEHFVLNELQARLQTRNILYWRDKRNHEIDFIIRRRTDNPVAIECKWSITNFKPQNARSFHNRYPKIPLIVVANNVEREYEKIYGELIIKFMNLEQLISFLLEKN